ncbi:MAG: glucoamylase family protein [Candidatus Omnitrophota bacterium]
MRTPAYKYIISAVTLSAAIVCLLGADVFAEKLTLNQAVETAVKNSLDMEIANLEKLKSDYRFKSKAADMLPKISNFSRYSSDEYSSDSANKGWLISEEIVQPIWKGGKLYYTKELYRNLKDIASVRAAEKELDIAFEVKRSFFEAMKYSELLKVSEEIEKVVSNHYENVDRMYKQGLVPKVDVLKTRSILDKAQLEHVQILNEYYLSKNNLNYILNVPLDTEYDIEYPARNLDVSLTMEESTNVCLARNPAMSAQNLKEKNADTEVGIARADLFPEVDAYGKIGNRFDSSDDSTEKSAGVMMSFDIWDWGKNLNELKASQVGRQQVKKEYDITVNRLTLGVRNAYTDYDISLKRIAAAKRFYNSVSEEFKKQLTRFNNGQATNQDVLDAEALYSKAGFELMESYAYCGVKKGALERAIGVMDISEVSSRPSSFENDMDFISYAESRMFLYFVCEQNKKTGLFRDTSGGGDSSIASTGFGLAALCIGAENGWISAEEARGRALKCLKTLDALDNRKDGLFYHFMQIDTGKRAGTSEISTVDTAILLYGVIAASEYFGGDVSELGYKIVNSVQWHKMVDADNLIFMGWTPEDKVMKSKWNYFTDEILLMSILALGSDEKVPENVFYSFKRNEMSYKDSKPFIVSWTGALFTYQYANIWLDLRSRTDKEGVDWYENSKRAARAQIAYCSDNAGRYVSLKQGAWGVSSCETEDGYTMAMGCPPCGEVRPEFDGTVSICGSVGSMVLTPFDSMRAAKYYYSRPELWGRYGLKNAFNDGNGWISNTSFGIDTGLMLLSIENFRNGLIWKLVGRSPVIQKGFERAGLKKNEKN